MKTDTLTGPNLSYHVAVLEGKKEPCIEQLSCFVLECDREYYKSLYDYSVPATFQPIAEREFISAVWNATGGWRASTKNKMPVPDNGRYSPTVSAWGDTEAEARMRCYVKSYLGENTKGE